MENNDIDFASSAIYGSPKKNLVDWNNDGIPDTNDSAPAVAAKAAKLSEIGISPTSVSPSDVTALGTRISDAEDAISQLQNATVAYDPTQGTVAGTVINLASGDFFKITNSANSTYSVSNAAQMNEGEVRNIYVNNGNYTWALSGVTWDGTAPTIPVNKLSWVQIQKLFGVACARMMSATGYALDVTAPTSSSFVIDATGTFATWTFSEPVQFDPAGPVTSGLTISYSGVTPSYQSGAGTNSLTITFSRTILASDGAGTINYTRPAGGIMDMSGNVLANITGGAVTNNSTATSYLLGPLTSESGTQGVFSQTASSTYVYNYTPSLRGTYSVKVTASGGASVNQTVASLSAPGSTVYGYFDFRTPSSWPATNSQVFSILDSSSAVLAKFVLTVGGLLRGYHGTAQANTGTLALSTDYRVWWDYVAASVTPGGDGILRMYVSTSDTKPAVTGQTTAGTSSGTVSKIGACAAYTVDGIFDTITVSANPITGIPN